MSGLSASKKRRGTRLKRTHGADRDSQRLFAAARQISLTQEQIQELREIGHSGKFSQDVAALASTYAMSKAMYLGKIQIRKDRGFLKKVQTKANRLLEVLAEKPAQPLVLYGEMAHIPQELERLLEQIEREQRVLTAKRAPDRENLFLVEQLSELFKAYTLPIANSREGAFCRCLGLILDAAGPHVDDPYHLIESWKKFSDEVPRIPSTFD